MSAADSGPLASPGFWLHHAALTWRARMETALGPFDLTHTQFMLLATTGWLEGTAGPPTQAQVAEHAGCDRQMTSRVVRTLQGRGLIARDNDRSDARALRLTLTSEGRVLARQAIQAVRDLDTRMFGADPARMRDALRAIAELRDADGTGP
ncbi:MarR family winged helix-turn-helix transcriptional regulator [Catenulispora rubra]|uniref:MarR family winged helix-turn-helix transcriptional regulator n=1 Tax=Catenulispora rubra TaxID=280293 RepID=UPI001892522E|nr:MarR family transcriptional regulator [Catenulispora rubra]